VHRDVIEALREAEPERRVLAWGNRRFAAGGSAAWV
jgi:hypothetical protein